jgi:hypothetical protein
MAPRKTAAPKAASKIRTPKKAGTEDDAPVALPGFTAPKAAYVPEKPQRLSPFDFLKAITQTKTNLMAQDPSLEKDYVPFIVCRALSYFSDTCKIANFLQLRAGTITHRQHFEFLLYSLPRYGFRKSEWYKPVNDDAVAVCAEYYGCSRMKARPLVALHTPEQLAYMKDRLSTGGTSK